MVTGIREGLAAFGIAGLLVMTTLGTVYSWSLFTQPLIAMRTGALFMSW